MIIAYLYDRPRADAAHLLAAKVFIDAPGTQRADLSSLVDSGGLRRGDVLRVCALSDLGHGAASKTIQDRIERLGVTLEVMPPEVKRPTGRLSTSHPRRADMCAVWWSSLDQADALAKMSDMAGIEVNRNKANRLCNYSRNPADKTLD